MEIIRVPSLLDTAVSKQQVQLGEAEQQWLSEKIRGSPRERRVARRRRKCLSLSLQNFYFYFIYLFIYHNSAFFVFYESTARIRLLRRIGTISRPLLCSRLRMLGRHSSPVLRAPRSLFFILNQI